MATRVREPGTGTYTLTPEEAASYQPLQVVSLAGRSGFGQNARVYGFGGSYTGTQTATQTYTQTQPTQTVTQTRPVQTQTRPTQVATKVKTEATKQFKVAEAAPTPPADPGGSKTVTEFEGDEKGKGQGKKGVHDRGQGKNERNEGKDDWFLKRWFAGLLGKGEEGGGVKGKERGNRNRNSEGRTDGKGKGKAKEGDNGGNVGEVEKHGKRRKLILKIKKKFGRSSKG